MSKEMKNNQTNDVINLRLTKDELLMLVHVVDNNDYDLMDGWEYLQEEDPELWEKKLKDLSSAKDKIYAKYR